MQLVRSLDILQPDFQWQYQLRHERDITAQVEAVRSLERYPTPGNKVFYGSGVFSRTSLLKPTCRNGPNVKSAYSLFLIFCGLHSEKTSWNS